MKNFLYTIPMFLFLSIGAQAQNVVKGIVLDTRSEKPLENVTITLKESQKTTLTKVDGSFVLSGIENGNYILEIKLKGFETQNFPLTFKGSIIDLGSIFLFADISIDQDLSIITLTDDELNDDSSAADNISGLLQATRDIYLRTAAFEFSNSFFRIRGLDSENGTILINGIEMNKLFDGRPQWSNWGGLNDVTRNQEFTMGLSPSNYTFGGILGTTNINTRATEQRPGTRISYASSNRSYVHRVMASYNTGLMENGWALSFSASRRAGQEGFNDGTFYNANSFFASIEKKINDKHSINLTSIFAPNKRGKSSSNTQEVYDLKGIQYNAFWGYQNGKIRNSRYKELVEPIIMLNHYWTINSTATLNTNVAYQSGTLGNSRIEFGGTDLNPTTGFPEGGGPNPDPTYYQKLPSYALRNFPDQPEIAFGLQQQFVNDGQMDWNAMYEANISNSLGGGNSIFALFEDRVDDTQFTINTIYNKEINNNISFTGSLNFRSLKSENFASIVDLLGGTGFLDVDQFASDLSTNPDQIQNDVRNPNRIVGVGDRFRYNFNINANVASAFAQAVFKYKKVDFYTSASITQTTYQREGLFQNGGFANNSFGKGEKVNFSGIGVKGGVTYKLTGRHLFDFNAGYLTKAPTIRNTFSNSRENHDIAPNITEEKILSIDASYILRSPVFQGRVTGFLTKISDANEVSFFFADGIGGDNTAFVQEILQGIDKRHAGIELGLEAQITATLKLRGVASLSQNVYDNNPNLYLTSEDFTERRDLGKSFLKNYRLPSGPQTAYSIGFEYRDPDFWWFSTTANFMDNAYIDVSPLQRSANFYKDFDGLPFNDYDPIVAAQLLRQEKFDNYMFVNIVGGKSWKINNTFLSVFASVTNLFNQEFKTGGFEQGRNANYRQLLADQSLDTPVFGPRYWLSRGTTYFLNFNLRF